MPEDSESEPLGFRWVKKDDEWYICHSDMIAYLESTYDKMAANQDAGWVAFLRAMITRFNEILPGSGGSVMRVWSHGDD